MIPGVIIHFFADIVSKSTPGQILGVKDSYTNITLLAYSCLPTSYNFV